MQGLMIGVTGEFLAGKSTVADIIKRRYLATPSARYSDSLREFVLWVKQELVGHQVIFPARYAALAHMLEEIFYPEVLTRTSRKNALNAFAFWLTEHWGGQHYFRVEEDRKHLQDLSTALRSIFAENILERAVASRIEKMHSKTPISGIIEGVRRLVDIGTLLRDPLYAPRFRLLYLECDPRVAFERMHERKENSDDATMTWEEFQKLRGAEAENQITLLKPHAHAIVHNNDAPDALTQHVECVVEGWILG